MGIRGPGPGDPGHRRLSGSCEEEDRKASGDLYRCLRRRGKKPNWGGGGHRGGGGLAGRGGRGG
ncbi:MAG: hypothetical protein OXF20_10845, partial [Gammaproteobacteria bacterium]|nr:hypothetical protein [Gammaproteobacteria bacterium]